MANWYDSYIGKPWVANPDPPNSFNCGELLRYVHKQLGISTTTIDGSAARLRDCISSMKPLVYGLIPLGDDEAPREFDCAFFSRTNYDDHCGIAAQTADGLLVLHCLQGVGVVLEREIEAKVRGFKNISWYRHRELQAPVGRVGEFSKIFQGSVARNLNYHG